MAAFDWLQQREAQPDETLSRMILEQGFELGGIRIRLVGTHGIFKPKQIEYYPLSITTTTNSPYADSFHAECNFLHYSYRGTDPNFHENRRLRDVMQDQVPLIYFYGTVLGRYLAFCPVYIVGDDPAQLRLTVAADDFVNLGYERDDADHTIRRAYVTRQVRQRIHQRSESPRLFRRLHHLRGWSNGQTHEVFPGSTGTGGSDGVRS